MLHYLAGTKRHGITYSKNHPKRVLDGENQFHGYADAYDNTDDYKSTSGYIFQAGGGAITWRSKKQATIALSSTEAEYVALFEAGHEACWLRSLFEELGENKSLPTLIKGDNDGLQWHATHSFTKGLNTLLPDVTGWATWWKTRQLTLKVAVILSKQLTY